MHDGIRLPRAVRKTGYRSDLFDCTVLCACRMCFGWGSAWRGFAKNAYEGLGNPLLLVFLTAVQRTAIHRRVKLPVWVAALHPAAIVVMTAIQRHSFVPHLTGRRTWRGGWRVDRPERTLGG